jgi:peptidoglycan-N-acetylglucosamine deacetylase
VTAEGDGGFVWPGGASVAVSLTFDVDAEAGWLGEGEQYRSRLTTLSEGRYGVVRGMPRILRLLAEHGIKASFFVPGYTAEQHPGLVLSILEAGHEVGHHGYLHLRSDKISADAQRDEIERGLDALERAGAPRPRGYRSTSWELTPETLALLVEHRFQYDSSCMGDDRPYVEEHNGVRILELPVHWSLDDWPRFGWSIDAGGNVADSRELVASWAAEYVAARTERRHLLLTMHPEVIGRAHRLAAFEELIMRMRDDGRTWFAPLDQVAAHVSPMVETQ